MVFIFFRSVLSLFLMILCFFGMGALKYQTVYARSCVITVEMHHSMKVSGLML